MRPANCLYFLPNVLAFLLIAIFSASSAAYQTQEKTSISIATQNLYHFFDTEDDPQKKDRVYSKKAFNTKLVQLNELISGQLACPDILAVQEVENKKILDQLARGSCWQQKRYRTYLLEGNDISGIDVGFLVSSSLIVKSVKQLGKHVRTGNGRSHLFDRPPLHLKAYLKNQSCETEIMSLVAVHNRSFKGMKNPNRVKPIKVKRREQARWLGSWASRQQNQFPDEKLIIFGDFNATPQSAEIRQFLASSEHGLFLLANIVPKSVRYSYLYRGKPQAIDHIVVSKRFSASVQSVRYTQNHLMNRTTKEAIVSDHAGMLAKLNIVCHQNY